MKVLTAAAITHLCTSALETLEQVDAPVETRRLWEAALSHVNAADNALMNLEADLAREILCTSTGFLDSLEKIVTEPITAETEQESNAHLSAGALSVHFATVIRYEVGRLVEML